MDDIEIFIIKFEEFKRKLKLRDACNEVIKAYESKDETAIENALGKFVLLMVQLDCLK